MKLPENNKAVILTGAPGVGKTSLLNVLRNSSVKCISEPARKVLAEQRAKHGEALPEKNSEAFCKLLLAQSIKDYDLNKDYEELTVFDRGVPDNVAYANCFGLNTDMYYEASRKHPYNKKVFLLSPWEEIYTTDDERKMTFQQVCEFHKLICEAYEQLEYELVEVPRASTQERANFIMSKMLN